MTQLRMIRERYEQEMSLQHQQLQREKDTLVQEKNEAIRQKDIALEEKICQIDISNILIEDQRRIIQQKNEIIQQQDAELQNRPWIVETNEVNLTNEKIGGGAYGEVKVGIFRGIHVAAKCLHELIVSRHDRSIFMREMEISSRIHHPNIVQFIGATRIDNPILLYELMPTSLYKRLHRMTSH